MHPRKQLKLSTKGKKDHPKESKKDSSLIRAPGEVYNDDLLSPGILN